MKLLHLTLVLALFAGCARFHTVQHDRRFNECGILETEICTKATAISWFSSKQLAQWRATQTEKQQSAQVGVEQQGATNAMSIATAIAEGATAAALKAVK